MRDRRKQRCRPRPIGNDGEHARQLVLAGRGQSVALVVERQRMDRPGMLPVVLEKRRMLRIPDADHLAADRQKAAIGTERQRADLTRMGQRVHDFTPRQTADLDLPRFEAEREPCSLGIPAGGVDTRQRPRPGQGLVASPVPDHEVTLIGEQEEQVAPGLKLEGPGDVAVDGSDCHGDNGLPQRVPARKTILVLPARVVHCELRGGGEPERRDGGVALLQAPSDEHVGERRRRLLQGGPFRLLGPPFRDHGLFGPLLLRERLLLR